MGICGIVWIILWFFLELVVEVFWSIYRFVLALAGRQKPLFSLAAGLRSQFPWVV